MNLPIHWRLRQARYQLLGLLCIGCNQPTFPPRPLCPECAFVPDIDNRICDDSDYALASLFMDYVLRSQEEKSALTYDLEEETSHWD
jgi:predicted amidophosphoribosyltransferase